ncbi:MAG: endopeptidase [Miltoncostaeaceae bacterium]|nr:endopeptidase [Miltoncostaeaceae bacterium]
MAALRLGVWSGRVPHVEPAPLAGNFDPDALERNRDYRRGVWTMAAVGIPLVPAIAIAAAALGGRWRPAVVRAARGRPWRAGLIAGGGLAIVASVATLPLGAARFAWGRSYGIVTQPLAGWLADAGKSALIEAALLGAVGAVVAVLMARLPRAWPAAVAALVAGLAFAMSLLAPVVIEPLFQKTEPLRDPVLAREVLDLAHRSGVDADRVLVSDASRRTTAANAYVSGLGHSRRIVLYDTLLRDFPRDQVRMVVAHELAHVRHRHVLKGTTWGAALALPACLLLLAAVGWRTGWAAPRRGTAEGTDLVVRRLAVAAAAAATIGAVATPLGAWVSRAYEREADWSALQVTHDPGAAIRLQQGLVRRSLNVPDPPEAVQVWFGTHPTALERIALAERSEEAP